MTALFSKLFKKNRPSEPAITKTPATGQALSAQATSEHHQINKHSQIQQIQSLDALEPFLNAKSRQTKIEAIDRLERIVFEDADTLDEKAHKLKVHTDETARKLVALWHPDEPLQRLAVEYQLETGAVTQQQICAWIEQNPVSRTRQILASYITHTTLLESLYQQFRSKDKRLSRQLKNTLQKYQEKERAQAQVLRDRLKIIEQLEQLAISVYSPHDNAQLVHAQQQWQQRSAAISHELEVRYATALKQAQSKIDQYQAAEHAREALDQRITETHEQQKALVKEAQTLLKQLTTPDETQQNTQDLESVTLGCTALDPFALGQLQQRWSTAAAAAKPDTNTKAAFQAALKPLIQFQESSTELLAQSDAITALMEQTTTPVCARYQQLDQCLQSIQWPKNFACPKILNDAIELQQRLKQQLKANKDQEKRSLTEYKKAIDSLKQSLDKKGLKESQKYHHKAAHIFKQLSPETTEPLQAEFKSLSAQLQELKDWQGFATLPKREALCESMEALMTSDMHPESLATAIQALQDEWKSLGSGDPKISQPLWERFKAASDQAYASCKAFYKAQAEIRQKNFESRIRICEELEQLLADDGWDRNHWKAIQTVIEGAKTQWRQFTPVDRVKNKSLQNRFQESIHALKALVQFSLDRHAEAKSELVEKAKALLSSNDLKQATEQAKQLQQQWKLLGSAGSQDQTLWKAFREHCDALFDKRQTEYLAKKEVIEANIAQAEILIEQGKALLDQPGLSATEQLQQHKTLSAQFNNIELPKSVQQRLQQKLGRIEQELIQTKHQQHKRRLISQWQNLRDKSQIITDLETHLIQSTQADLTALSAAFLTPADLPKEALVVLQARWQLATEALEDPSQLNLQTVLSKHEDQLRLLCIRLEILADAETPKEDRERRMNYQVQMLAKGIGQSNKMPPLAAAQSLELEWHQTGPVPFSTREQLSRRFFSLMDQLIEKLQKNYLSH